LTEEKSGSKFNQLFGRIDLSTWLLLLILIAQLPQMWGVFKLYLITEQYIEEMRTIHQTMLKQVSDLDTVEKIYVVNVTTKLDTLDNRLHVIEDTERDQVRIVDRILQTEVQHSTETMHQMEKLKH
jgi:hypothetical protein